MKYCHQCGKQLPDEVRFCNGCGASRAGIDNEKDMKANQIGKLPTATMPAGQKEEASNVVSAG